MGCCCSQPEDPAMERFRRAASYKAKSQVIIEIAARQERGRFFVSAMASYSTYLRCMAVHCFKEADRKKKDEMINMAQHSRTIYAHRTSLKNRAIQESNSCCGPSFVFAEPSAPQMLAPYEWSSWLALLKSGESVEAMLKKMGLIKMESKETIALRLAEASKSTTNVSVALNNSVNNNNESRNEVNPNINVAGPTTNIAANPNMSNAQTGEGNVAPATGGGGMQQQGAAMMMVPTGSGAFVMMPAGSGAGGSSLGSGSMGGVSMGGSGDWALMAAQQQMAALMQQNQMLAAQQQQMMAMAGMQQQGMGGMQGMQGMQPGMQGMQPGMQQAYYNPQQMQGMGQGMPGGSGNMMMGMQGMGMGMAMGSSGQESFAAPDGYPVAPPVPGVPAQKVV